MKIVKLCQDHNINLVIYINPVHCIFGEGIYESGAGRIFEEWKRWIASVHPVYDFAHYSEIGTEPFSPKRQYWRNTQHPMPLTGDMVLRKLVGRKVPEEIGEFGYLLTESNVEEILEMERRNREIWRENNPETVLFAQNLVKQY